MTLSARERLVLNGIARQITAEEPRLAQAMTALGSGPVTAERIKPVRQSPAGRRTHAPLPPAEYGRTVGLIAAGLAVLALAMLFTPGPNAAPRRR